MKWCAYRKNLGVRSTNTPRLLFGQFLGITTAILMIAWPNRAKAFVDCRQYGAQEQACHLAGLGCAFNRQYMLALASHVLSNAQADQWINACMINTMRGRNPPPISVGNHLNRY
jgi:hypothetical protein